MLNEDLGQSFPKILRNEISVHVIQSRGHILNTYDEALSVYAENKFAHDQVEVITNARVKEVREDKILFTQKEANGETVTKELPMGFCLWSTGVCTCLLISHCHRHSKVAALRSFRAEELSRTSQKALLTKSS